MHRHEVIYTAESIPLAFLENKVRRQGVGFNQDFKIMFIEMPGNAQTTIIAVDKLEDGWRNFHDYSKCQALGDKWYNDGHGFDFNNTFRHSTLSIKLCYQYRT